MLPASNGVILSYCARFANIPQLGIAGATPHYSEKYRILFPLEGLLANLVATITPPQKQL
jgi:hypothetical protein